MRKSENCKEKKKIEHFPLQYNFAISRGNKGIDLPRPYFQSFILEKEEQRNL